MVDLLPWFGIFASLSIPNKIQLLSINKQYVKIKLMQNETKSLEYFFGKDEILVKL